MGGQGESFPSLSQRIVCVSRQMTVLRLASCGAICMSDFWAYRLLRFGRLRLALWTETWALMTIGLRALCVLGAVRVLGTALAISIRFGRWVATTGTGSCRSCRGSSCSTPWTGIGAGNVEIDAVLASLGVNVAGLAFYAAFVAKVTWEMSMVGSKLESKRERYRPERHVAASWGGHRSYGRAGRVKS